MATLRKGEEWGRSGRLPADAPRIDGDAPLAAAVATGVDHVRLTGGDLARTVGVTPRSLEREEQMLLPVDLLSVEFADGSSQLVAAHAVLWRSGRPRIAFMNAAFVGRWNLAPRAHPGDGKVDRVEMAIGGVDWLKARRRLPTGSHVPHPDIRARAGASFEIEGTSSGRWRFDGQRSSRNDVTCVSIIGGLLTVGV